MTRILTYLLTAMQLGLAVVVAAMQYFSDTRMGMMRYLVYQNQQFTTGLFTEKNIAVYQMILAVLLLAHLGWLLISRVKRHPGTVVRQAAVLTAMNSTLFILVCFHEDLRFDTYYFLLLAGALILVLQWLKSSIGLFKFHGNPW